MSSLYKFTALHKRLNKHGVRLLNPNSFPHSLTMQCFECGQEWEPGLSKGGKFGYAATRCPHRCDKTG